MVASNQVGCLLGKGGTIISEMRKFTGTNIKILGDDQLPKCARENDKVVQVRENKFSSYFSYTTKLENKFYFTYANASLFLTTSFFIFGSSYVSSIVNFNM